MKIPSFKRIIKDKFPEEQLEWLDLLLSPLNSFMDEIAKGLNKKITVTENMDGEIKQITVDGTYPLKVKWDLPTRPQIGIVGQVTNPNGTPVTLTAAPYVNWTFNQSGQIEIKQVLGVPAGKHTITMLFLNK